MAGEFYLGLDILTYGATWASALETVELADHLGYDGAYTADHLFATGGDPAQPFFEGWTSLAAWSQRTALVDLGLLVQPWSGVVLEHIAAIGLWRANASEVIDAIGALQSAGARGFIAQVYPPYDHETIEVLTSMIAPALGWTPRSAGGQLLDGARVA